MVGSGENYTGVVAIAGLAAVTLAFVAGSKFGRARAPGMVSGGKFMKMNLPTVGPRQVKALPKGKATLQLYSLGTPNGQKVTIFLEELNVSYDAHIVDIMNGDQFGSEFVSINPNSKIPALLDMDGPDGKPITIFESGAILLYLAEKFKSPLLPSDPRKRQDCINWLFCQIGSSPYFGQFGHFTKYAPGADEGNQITYAVHRYKTETQRLCSLLERQLSCGSTEGGTPRNFLIGSEITIADIAWAPWIGCLDWGYHARKNLRLDEEYPHLMRWYERVMSRRAARIGAKVNGFKSAGTPPEFINYSKVV